MCCLQEERNLTMPMHMNCYPSVFRNWLRLRCRFGIEVALLARNRVMGGVRLRIWTMIEFGVSVD